eukprot:g3486.t1
MPKSNASSKNNSESESNALKKGNTSVTPNHVVIHPLVLLSVVDHYNRCGYGTTASQSAASALARANPEGATTASISQENSINMSRKKGRVVGVLLGESWKGQIDCTNSFAVPFSEHSDSVWYLDADFLESMTRLFKKINAKERIVGFYCTGNSIRPNDLHIQDMFRKYCKDPIMALVDVDSESSALAESALSNSTEATDNGGGIPIKAYYAQEIVKDGREINREFVHVHSSVSAYEAEEVGVECLLRGINDPSVSELAGSIRHRINSMSSLRDRLLKMSSYLGKVVDGKLPVNQEILATVQQVLNIVPDLNASELQDALIQSTNDRHLAIYLSSLARSIISLHELLRNRLEYRANVKEYTEKQEKAKQEKLKQLKKKKMEQLAKTKESKGAN